MARTPRGPKQVETLTHDDARRRNIPTAELQSTAEYLEEMHPAQPAVYPRARPLAEGERRERDEDLDPQIIWNGVRIRLTREQREQLEETGEVEIGDTQLVWRGKDTQDWSDLIVQAPPLYIQEKIRPMTSRRCSLISLCAIYDPNARPGTPMTPRFCGGADRQSKLVWRGRSDQVSQLKPSA